MDVVRRNSDLLREAFG